MHNKKTYVASLSITLLIVVVQLKKLAENCHKLLQRKDLWGILTQNHAWMHTFQIHWKLYTIEAPLALFSSNYDLRHTNPNLPYI